MSHTKRHPVARQVTHPQITPHAIGLFEELERARRQGDRELWWELQSLLHHELHAPLWDWPVCSFGPTDKHDADALAMWRELNEARRAQRRASRIGEATDAAPRHFN